MDQKNSDNATLSVIIPAYNCREYLERCVRSVLLADPFEIIIIDDGSADGTEQVCKKLMNCYKNIILIQNNINRGVVTSRCIGVSKATGKYIAFVDADDWIEPDFLIQAVRELECRELIDIVAGRTLQDNGSGVINYISFIAEEKMLEHREAVRELFDWNYYRWELWGKVYRRRLFYGWQPDESIRICEDLDSTWNLFRNANKTLCLSIDYYHYFYNEKSASYTVNSVMSNSYKVFERICGNEKDELGDLQIAKVKEHYRRSLINLIRELLFQDGDRTLIEETQQKLNRLYDDMNLEKTTAVRRLCQNYNSAKSLLGEMEEETVKLFSDIKQDGKQVYLYGTGIVSDFISRVLQKKDYWDYEYVVSDGQMKRSFFHGRKVSFVNQVAKESVILLSVNRSVQDQLYFELQNRGYQYIYKIDTWGIV